MQLPLQLQLQLQLPLQLPLQLQLQLQLPLPLLFKSPLIAPCRRCPEREKVRRLSERSEFSRAPLGVPPSREPRAARRDHRGRLFWRSKTSDPAAGTDSRLVSTAGQSHCVTR